MALHYATLEPSIAPSPAPEVVAAAEPSLLSREEAVRQIKAAGKVPATPEYPDKAFVEEVCGKCGVTIDRETGKPTKRGFHRKTLHGIFDNQLKSESG